MRSLKKARFAIIGGTGFERLFKKAEETQIRTPYGVASLIYIGEVDDRKVAFLPRHGPKHSVPPHKINYRANIYALHKLSVERILAVNAVGAINRDFKPGDIVVPHDFVDFTKHRSTTFYDKAPVTHIDVSSPYCPEIRELLVETSKKMRMRVWDRAVLVCTEGPRFETPAEIEMFRRFGCDVVGMTGVPEVVLARELEMCYAALCFVSNMAAGMQERLTPSEVSKISRQIMPKMEQILIETVGGLPLERGKNCPCARALKNARLK
ncbi:MAG: S-methyl-5'-thioadenosine phosphorylase [Candidatus Bathycorpusculaceae bacterium]